MTRITRRLARLTPGELRFRALDHGWRLLERVHCASGGSRWHREDLPRRLSGHSPEMRRACEALSGGRWASANEALRQHYLMRPRAFLIDPARRTEVAAAISRRFPDAQDASVQRAGRILDGRYDLLGYRDLSFRPPRPVPEAGDIDWHLDPVHGRRAPLRFWTRVPYLDPANGDHKIIWELNRHQHWLALGRAAWLTGSPTYATAFSTQLASWMRANPPLLGINWASMLELAFRSLSWIWALHFFAPFDETDESGWAIDLLLGLSLQLDHIGRHLSTYFSPNTHLLGEALALYVAGRALPELAPAAKWERVGRDILIAEATAQVHADGGHAELSTHYHRYALDFYLLALLLARRTGDGVAAVFEEVTGRLATFCRALADDNGRLPTIGDDDGGMLFPICGRTPADASDSLALASVVLDRPDLAVGDTPEEVSWLLGGETAGRHTDAGSQPGCRLFPDTGYALLRSRDAQAILDVGPHGFLNGGHAHADALSVVLTAAGRPLFVDPGTATYTMNDRVRDRFRATAMHNTLVLDGRPQSVPAGPFHWRSRADGRVVDWHAARDCCHAEGEHDGYSPVIHRRAVTMLEEGLWIVADHVLGEGHHDTDVFWHLGEGWSRDARNGASAWSHASGVRAFLVSTAGSPEEFCGDEAGLGWVAPVYGQLLPSRTLRFRSRGAAPFTLVTCITAGIEPARVALHPLEIVPDRVDGWHRAAVQIAHGDATLVAVYSTRLAGVPPAASRGSQRITGPDGDLVTDARVAVLRLTYDGEPVSLRLLSATHASWTGRSSLAIPASAAAQDLHLDRHALRRLSRKDEARPVG